MKRSFFLTLAATIFLASHAFAVTLSQYRESIATARVYIGELKEYSYTTAENYDPDEAERIVTAIKAELPARTSVDQPGGSVEASNDWLHANLDAFLDEEDGEKRSALLTDSEERLDALTQKMDELVSATAGTRSKDEDKQKLAEILRREEFQKPKPAQESLIQRWWNAFLEWLVSLLPRSSPNQPNLTGMPNLAFFLQILLYVVIAALIIFGLYKLAPVIFPKLKLKRRAKSKERVILGERIAEDMSAVDLFAEAERLATEGDLRGAIRKGYIALICDLSDKRLIGLARHKTNRDYLRELRQKRELLAQMSGVTNEFERSWYGSQAANANDWQGFRENCERTMQIARAEG